MKPTAHRTVQIALVCLTIIVVILGWHLSQGNLEGVCL